MNNFVTCCYNYYTDFKYFPNSTVFPPTTGEYRCSEYQPSSSSQGQIQPADQAAYILPGAPLIPPGQVNSQLVGQWARGSIMDNMGYQEEEVEDR